jgi:30S ribosomal protein S31
MGKGDTRTRRGKVYRGTHGKTRRRKKNKGGPQNFAAAKAAASARSAPAPRAAGAKA